MTSRRTLLILSLVVPLLILLGLLHAKYGSGSGIVGAHNSINGKKLHRYLMDRYGRAVRCLELNSVDGVDYWVELRTEMDDCDTHRFRFLTLTFRFTAVRVYFRIVAPGDYVDDFGCKVRIGPAPEASPAAVMLRDKRHLVLLLDPAFPLGALPGILMSNQLPGAITFGLVLAHELDGHLTCAFDGALTKPSNDACAVEAENQFRRTWGDDSPVRFVHDLPGPVKAD